jgi:hypothetical protein
MADNISRSTGRSKNYKFDRGGMPSEFGPFIGIVTNNVDPTRSGRLQVWIAEFGSVNKDGTPNLTDESTWRTVSYLPPFYGITEHSGAPTGAGGFVPGNRQSYGMWFTPPDIGVSVMCFFAGGDPTQGYYVGCVPEPGLNHMIPAIGASKKFKITNPAQANYFAGATQLPVVEINDENEGIDKNPKFYDSQKPVHSVQAAILFQQGLVTDNIRGPITSNSQRESPSTVYGISTPGRPVYQGGFDPAEIKQKLQTGQIKPQDVMVIGRQGGHTFVMDDGDLTGKNTLVRIRSAKGHQITMSDDGNCFYITHANGQTWLEFGAEGSVDVFSTNSINLRTKGTLNFHADGDINMFAGKTVNIKSGSNTTIEASAKLNLISQAATTIYSKSVLGLLSDGALNLKSKSGGWNGGSALNIQAGCINLNGGGAPSVSPPISLRDLSLTDVKFTTSGWKAQPGTLKTIVTRAPTHEPYPYHNQGVNAVTSLGEGIPAKLEPSAEEAIFAAEDAPLEDQIDIADYTEQPTADDGLGSLDQDEFTGVLAQSAVSTGQQFDEIVPTDDNVSVGAYGLNSGQLETLGYVKPGTTQQLINGDPTTAEKVLANPSVWTGKGGINTLTGFLSDKKTQSTAQQALFAATLSGLKQKGAVTGNEPSTQLGGILQVGAKFGVDTAVKWLNGNAPSSLINNIAKTARQGLYATAFSNQKLGSLGRATVPGYNNTVQRSSIDTAVGAIINSSKIPTPDFSNPGTDNADENV